MRRKNLLLFFSFVLVALSLPIVYSQTDCQTSGCSTNEKCMLVDKDYFCLPSSTTNNINVYYDDHSQINSFSNGVRVIVHSLYDSRCNDIVFVVRNAGRYPAFNVKTWQVVDQQGLKCVVTRNFNYSQVMLLCSAAANCVKGYSGTVTVAGFESNAGCYYRYDYNCGNTCQSTSVKLASTICVNNSIYRCDAGNKFSFTQLCDVGSDCKDVKSVNTIKASCVTQSKTEIPMLPLPVVSRCGDNICDANETDISCTTDCKALPLIDLPVVKQTEITTDQSAERTDPVTTFINTVKNIISLLVSWWSNIWR